VVALRASSYGFSHYFGLNTAKTTDTLNEDPIGFWTISRGTPVLFEAFVLLDYYAAFVGSSRTFWDNLSVPSSR
jgi:hypothetical protein